MGKTSIPLDRRPTEEERHQLADESLRSPTSRMIDRSGWIGWNHRFSLHQLNPDHDPDNPARRHIVVSLSQWKDGELVQGHWDETEGPNYVDCPMRILKAANEFPPPGGYAGKWRQEALEYNHSRSAGRKFLTQLAQEPPNGDLRLVLKNGRTVRYRKAGQTHAYQTPEHPIVYYRLKPEDIDLEATARLRSSKAAETGQRQGPEDPRPRNPKRTGNRTLRNPAITKE